MTERIRILRQQSLEAEHVLHHERAMLVTTFYRDHVVATDPVPVQRARCLQFILENKHISIDSHELLVGERGPAPKATPTYPEINLHSLEDLDVLHNRPKVSFRVTPETRNAYEEIIIPFWKGRTNRDRLMERMCPAWHAAYDAGVFTEFQEQRAPGHTVLGEKAWKKGMVDLIRDCEASVNALNQQDDLDARQKRDELRAMIIAAEALISFAVRHADILEERAQKSGAPGRKAELIEMARICRKVPAEAPETFHEALQHYWFMHLGVITELNPWDSFSPGRLDQHLLPFYKAETTQGSLSRDGARELLQCLWVKFNNHPAPPKMGVTAKESNTYTDFCLVNLGGVTREGRNAVNDLSYLLLEVIGEMRILQPGSMIQVSRENPDAFVYKALEVIRTGFGQPSVFNTDTIIQELCRQGKSPEDARNGGASGCVESGAFGTEAYFLTGYFNLTKILELTLNDGFDKRTGRQVGPQTGAVETFVSFDSLMVAYEEQLRYFARVKMVGNRHIEELFASHLPAPFLSLLIDDCIANGIDYNAGGARYNSSYIQGVGLGSVTDSLTALRYHVFDRKTLSMNGMMDALNKNFSDYEEFREELIFNTPKFGNDDVYADTQAVRVFSVFFHAIDGQPCWRNGHFRINMLPTTCHIYFGSVTAATPDGRKAKHPLSEGISPVQGMDTHGPTAVLNSAAKIDHTRTGGTLLNQKFTPSFFDDEESYAKLTALIRTYFRMNGHHIQFNVVSADTLRDAQKYPERYRDLIVRVAGYSDYFNDLGEDLQNEIIRRTEHGE